MGESEGIFLLFLVVGLCIVFDYINGFHDTANAIATVVSTNVLPPRTAVLMAGMFNFVGAFLGTKVAKTIGGDIAQAQLITQTVIAAALTGAIVWNLLTWYFGIPSSSSHALVGGLCGAVITAQIFEVGLSSRVWGAFVASTPDHPNGVVTTIKFLVISPLVGFFGGFVIMVLLTWLARGLAPSRVNKTFRALQLLSSGSMALSHGSNDAQKAMGIVTLACVSYYTKVSPRGDLPEWLAPNGHVEIPLWAKVVCATAIGFGTAAGGWRIMKTMGHKIIKLKPIHGFAAETAGALVIQGATHMFGAPVSTTHVISSAIMGVGASKRVSAVKWGIAGNILVAWVLTIPISCVVAGVCYVALRPVLGK